MVLKIGHRGAWGYEPENTILSFKKAVELGADFVELDVHLTKDNQLIVIHDETLNRTTTGKGKVKEKTLAEIRKSRTKAKSQPIPTLQEVVDELKGKIKIDVELKGGVAAEQVAELIAQNRMEKEIIVSSSEPHRLRIVKRKIPSLETALIYYSTKTTWRIIPFALLNILIFPISKQIIIRRARYAQVDHINLFFVFASKRFVARLHKLGFRVSAWTVNGKKLIKRMIENGVDGIISKYPDRVKL